MINPLLCALFEPDEVLRWRVVRAVGITVSAMAEKDLESARIIMRRLMWSLNDESGGIGWGAPEAMGEIMAENETLAREYYRILVSYIDVKGNLLENDELELGVMWGISRLAQKRPELLRDWTAPVMAQLKSPNPVKRGLALRTLLAVGPQPGWALPSAVPEGGRDRPPKADGLPPPWPSFLCLCSRTSPKSVYFRMDLSSNTKSAVSPRSFSPGCKTPPRQPVISSHISMRSPLPNVLRP